jgi:hypothetical protein
MFRKLALSALLLTAAVRADVAIQAPATQPTGKTIEVCFVLDTTGSMSGLIEGAKRKIWSIANSIVASNKGATVRFALVPYRDRGDEYITKVFDLTDDLDKVYENLSTFKADGGGDTPESVNQALADAVGKVHWSDKSEVAKLLFLVGDAPPHMDYSDDVKFPDTCLVAVKKGLIINTVQCGNMAETTPIWERISKLSEGSYVSLEQAGGMVTVETPMDKDIADLSNQIATRTMSYGPATQQAEVTRKNAVAAAAPASVAADRASFNAVGGGGGKAIQGRGDLISDLRENQVKLDDVPNDQLPKELQNLSRNDQEKLIEKKTQERDELSKKVAELSRKRQEYIDAENKRLAGHGDAFDAKVSEIVQKEVGAAR